MPNLKDILTNHEYQLLTKQLDSNFEGIFVTDLLSTAIKHVKHNQALITMISTQSTLSIAQMLDIEIIVLTQDANPSDDFIFKANEKDITIIKTNLLNHEVVIDFYQRGLV